MQQLNDCASCKSLAGVIDKLHAKFVIYKKKNNQNDEFIGEFKKQSNLLQRQHILMQALKDELQKKNASLAESLNKIRCSEVECTALRHMLEKEKEDCRKEITARLKDSDLELQSLRTELDRIKTELEAQKIMNIQLTEKLGVEATNMRDLQVSHMSEKKQLQDKLTQAENVITNFNRNFKTWSNMKDKPKELLKSVLTVVKNRERRNEAALIEANLLNSNDASDEEDCPGGPDSSPFSTPKKNKTKGARATTDSSDDDFEEVSCNKSASPVKSLNSSFSNGIGTDVIGSPSKRSPKKSPAKASPRKATCKTSPKKAVLRTSSPKKLSPKKKATISESGSDMETTVVRRVELVSTGCDPMESGNEPEERTEDIYLASFQREHLSQPRSVSPFPDFCLSDLETTITPVCEGPATTPSVLCNVCDNLVSRCTPCRSVLQEMSKRSSEAEPPPPVEEEEGRSLFSPPPPQEDYSSMSTENSALLPAPLSSATRSLATQTTVTSVRRRDVGTEPRKKITRTIGFQCDLAPGCGVADTDSAFTQTEPSPTLEESKCALCDNREAVCPMKEFLRTSLLNVVEQSKLVSAPKMMQFLETSLLNLIKQSDFISNCSGADSGYQTLRPMNAFCVPYAEVIPGGTPPVMSMFNPYAYHLDLARRMNTSFPTFKKEETSRPNSDEEGESRRTRGRSSRSNQRTRSGSVICEPPEIECGDTSVEEIEMSEGGMKRRPRRLKSLANPSKKAKPCTERSRTRTDKSESPTEFRYGRVQRLSESSEEEQETSTLATSTPKPSHLKDPPPTRCSAISKDAVREEASVQGRGQRGVPPRVPSVDDSGVLPRQVGKTSGVPAELPPHLPSMVDNSSVLPAQSVPGELPPRLPSMIDNSSVLPAQGVPNELPPRLPSMSENGVLPRQEDKTRGVPDELPDRLPSMRNNSVLPRQEDKTRGVPAELPPPPPMSNNAVLPRQESKARGVPAERSPRSLPLSDDTVMPPQEDNVLGVPADVPPQLPPMHVSRKVLPVQEDQTRQGISPAHGKKTRPGVRENKISNIVPARTDGVNAHLIQQKLLAAKTAISFVSGGTVEPTTGLSESSTKPLGGKVRKAHSRKVESPFEVPASPDVSKRYETRARGKSASTSPPEKSKKPSKPSPPDSRDEESLSLEDVQETTQPPKSVQRGNGKSKRKLMKEEKSKEEEPVQPKTSKKELIQPETSKKEEPKQPETPTKELMQLETSERELIQPETLKKKELKQPETPTKEQMQPETWKGELIQPEISKQKEPIQSETSEKQLIQLETSKEISPLPETLREEDVSGVDVRRALEDDLCLSDDSEDDTEAKSDEKVPVAKSDEKVPASIFDVPEEVVQESAANMQEKNQRDSPVAEAQTKELASEVESMDIPKQQETDLVSVEVEKEEKSMEQGNDVSDTSAQDVSFSEKSVEELIGLLQDESEERSEEATLKALGTEGDPVEGGADTAEKGDVNVQAETAVQETSAPVVCPVDTEMETVDRVSPESSLGNATKDLDNQEISVGLPNAEKTVQEAIGSAAAEPVSAQVVSLESVSQQKRRISSSETEEVEEKRQKREVPDSQTSCAAQTARVEPSESEVADGSSLVSPLVEPEILQGAENSQGAGEVSTALDVFPADLVSADNVDQDDVDSSMASLFGLLSDEEGSAPAENHQSLPTPEEMKVVSEEITRDKSPALFDDIEDTVEDRAEAVVAEKDVEGLLVQSDVDLSMGVFGSLFDDLPEAASLSTVVEAVLPDLTDDLVNAGPSQMVLEDELREPAEKMVSEQETAAGSPEMVNEIPSLQVPTEEMVVSGSAVSPNMSIGNEGRDTSEKMGSEPETAADSNKVGEDEMPSVPEAPIEKVVVVDSKQGKAAHPQDGAQTPPEDPAKIVSNSEQKSPATPVTPRRRLPVAAVPSGPYLTRRTSRALSSQTRSVTRKSAAASAVPTSEGRQLRSSGPVKAPEPKKMKFSSKEFISSDDSSESESERLVIDDSTSGRSTPQMDTSSETSSPSEDSLTVSPDLEAEHTLGKRSRKSSSSGRSTPTDKSPNVENDEAEKTAGTKGRRSASVKSSPLSSPTVENAEAEKTIGTRSGRKSAPASDKKYNLRQSAGSRTSDSDVERVELSPPSRKRRSPRNLSKVESSDEEVEAASDAEMGAAGPTKTSPRRASKLQKLRRNLSKAHPLMQKPSGRIAPAVKNEPPPKKGKADKSEESQPSVASSMQMAKSGRTVCLITEDPKNTRRPKLKDQPKATPQEVKIPTRLSAKPRITPQERIAALQARSNDVQANTTEAPSEPSTSVPEPCPAPKTPSWVLPKPRVTPQERRAVLDVKPEPQPTVKTPPKFPPAVKLEERVFKRSNSIRKLAAGRAKDTPSPVVRLTPNLPPFAAKPIAVEDDVFGVEAVIPQRPDFSPAAVPLSVEKGSPLKMTKSEVTSTPSASSGQPSTPNSDSPGVSGTASSLNPPVPLSGRKNIWVEPAKSMEEAVEVANPEPHKNQWMKKEPLGPITPVENVQPIVGRDLVALIDATAPALTHFTSPVESDSHPLVLAWIRRGDRLRTFAQMKKDMKQRGMAVPAIQKIFNAYLSSSKFDEDLLTNAVNTLLNPKLSFVDSVVARLAVDCVETDYDSEPCRDSVGPAMTKIQQQLIALIMRLFPRYRTIVGEVLLLIEHRTFCLGQNTDDGRLPWLTVLHTSLCRIMKWRPLALIFCYDAMYSFVTRYATVWATVFRVWPQLLPNTIDYNSASGLVQVMFHFVMTQGELSKQDDLKEVRDLLIKKRVYSGHTNSERLMENIVSRLKEGKGGLICPEMILVGKREGVSWTQSHVVEKYLLPMLRDWINYQAQLPPAVVLSLCGIVRVFNGQESSVETTHSLMKTLLQSAADHPELEHVAAAGHVFLARHNIDYVVQILKEWKPKIKSPEWLIRILVGLIFGTARQTAYWTNQMEDLLQQSKKSLFKQIKASPTVETPSKSLESMRSTEAQSSQ